jgi:hypothetical protein
MILIACNSNQIFRHSLPRTIIYTILLQRNCKAVRFPSTEPTFL